MSALSNLRALVHPIVTVGLLLVPGAAPGAAHAQPLPDRPFSWLDNRLTVSGDASASTAKFDDGWFNDLDYGANTLRLVTLGAGVQARLHPRLAVLGEVRVENTNTPRILALFARVRPWRDRPIDIQVGRIPPVFGTFGRRRYGTDNPLIGFPLAYQYLTTLRADVVPASPDALLAVRGDGWYVRYPSRIGNGLAAPGLPLSSAYVWDTGVQVRVGGPVEVAVALTNGSLAAPRVADDNRGKHVSTRISGRPRTWLAIGASASTGAYVSNDVLSLLDGSARQYAQRAYGVDVELARDHWLLRAEMLGSRFESPRIGAGTAAAALAALASSVEARYKLHPRLYAAGRAEHLGFSRIVEASSSAGVPWDAPVTRLEFGGGVYLLHNAIGKLVYQHNWRRMEPNTQSQGRVAAQLSYWF